MNSAEERLRARWRAVNASFPDAPPRVESILLAAYRKRYRRVPRRYAAIPLAAAVALAAGMLPDRLGPTTPLPAGPKAPPAPAFAYLIAPKPKPQPVVRRVRAVPRPALPAEEYIPLFPGAPMLPLDGAHVVRVAIPRSALLPAGFPVNPARLNERVRADVLMGEDGLIRGIRFVR